MKRYILLLLLIVILVGCGGEDSTNDASSADSADSTNATLIRLVGSAHRLIDYEAQVVCYHFGSGSGGSCLRLSDTALPRE